MKKVLVSGAALAAVLALTAPAHAVTTYFSGYTTASSPGGVTPDIAFSAPGGAHVDVSVTDCCAVGDYYATYLDGAYLGTTPYEPEFGSSSGYPNSAATFAGTLGGGGTHYVQLVDQTDFFLPAGVYIDITSAAPEPATWSLMLVGVFGLGAVLRSRKSRLLKPEVDIA